MALPWTQSPLVRSAFMFLLVAGVAACDGDSSDPAGPGAPAGSASHEVALASNELMSGGSGVLVSDGFAGLELEPAIGDDGLIIPGRWSNLRVKVGGVETDVRRLDGRSVEFSVPTLPGGTVGVDVSSPLAHGSTSARVLGVIASEQVVQCFINPDFVVLVPVGDALVFDTDCSLFGGRHGVGVTWPAVPGRGFEWLPEGEVHEAPWVSAGPSHRANHFVGRRTVGSSITPEFWLWEAGRNPRPVEALNCFGTADVSHQFAAPAEVGDGTCLLIVPQSGVILRDGEPVAEWPRFNYGHFVTSDDGWMTARNTSRLVVFNPAGELVLAEDIGHIHDARFAPGGGRLYVAVEDRLRVIDRETGDVLREATVSGTVHAVAASEGRLWLARTTGPMEDELLVELFDPETLDSKRSITVTRDLARDFSVAWPYHGAIPVLLEDATGTRLTYTGRPLDFLGVWSHVIEVF